MVNQDRQVHLPPSVFLILRSNTEIESGVHAAIGSMCKGERCVIRIESLEKDSIPSTNNQNEELTNSREKHSDGKDSFICGDSDGNVKWYEIALRNWQDFVDISPEEDNSIMIICSTTETGWEKPNELCELKLDYILRSEVKCLKIQKEAIQPYLSPLMKQKFLKDLKLQYGSMAFLQLKGKYGFEDLRLHPERKPQQFNLLGKNVHFEYVSIVSMENLPKSKLLDVPHKIQRGESMKEQGNMWYHRNCIERALRRYTMGIDAVEYLGGKSTAEDDSFVKPLLINLYSNASMCFLKLQNYLEALTMTEKVLLIENENEKGLYRKVQALKGLKKLFEAEKWTRQALHLYPKKKVFRKELASISALIRSNPDLLGMYQRMWQACKNE
ncbi:tetratricopeptide repeat-containing protein [Cardiosporidium cionae]|uniref:Tetratricopeptide repeat-containing protein n=1 Tax=Cardiosporidium cionae TaxID=476202 RepID=A0ABQ7JEC6_9APIC|nr:tetratricopeptide repeat-containing protein [Cardiosporidium cionae]|eukprot:KAF8822346.1 tetratricopeptide repeat-containing protein [Cardiosporidium cionae]